MAKSTDWFPYKGYQVQWLAASPGNRASLCDRCGATVHRDSPRLRIDNDSGPERRRGKGKRHEYICATCAREVPNKPVPDTQGTMF